MNENYAKASRERWAKIPIEERKSRMSTLASIKWQKMSIKKRKEHSFLMLSAKKKKNGKENGRTK